MPTTERKREREKNDTAALGWTENIAMEMKCAPLSKCVQRSSSVEYAHASMANDCAFAVGRGSCWSASTHFAEIEIEDQTKTNRDRTSRTNKAIAAAQQRRRKKCDPTENGRRKLPECGMCIFVCAVHFNCKSNFDPLFSPLYLPFIHRILCWLVCYVFLYPRFSLHTYFCLCDFVSGHFEHICLFFRCDLLSVSSIFPSVFALGVCTHWWRPCL